MRLYLSDLKKTTKGLLQDLAFDYATGDITGLIAKRGFIPVDKIISWQPLQLKADVKANDNERPTCINQPKVITESGEQLGQVHDLQIDTDTQKLSQICVRKTTAFWPLSLWQFAKKRLIDADQIVQITSKNITVKDSTSKVEIQKEAPALTEPMPL